MSNTHDPVAFVRDKVHEWSSDLAQSRVAQAIEDNIVRPLSQAANGALAMGGVGSAQHVPQPPPPPPPPKGIVSQFVKAPFSYLVGWTNRHRYVAAFIGATGVVGLGVGVIMMCNGDGPDLVGGMTNSVYGMLGIEACARRSSRRAVRAPSGARTQVVLMVGSPMEAIVRHMVTDLHRRGFIVYWACNSVDEEAMVDRERQNNPDIRKLSLNPEDCAMSMQMLSSTLSSPARDHPGTPPHRLSLAGVVLVPDMYFPSGPVETIRPDVWSDCAYSKLLGPVFLLCQGQGLIDLVREQKSRVVFVTPSIISSLNPAFHAPECMAVSAINSLALCLHRELKPQGIPVVQLRLGSFAGIGKRLHHSSRPSASTTHTGTRNGPSQARAILNKVRADILSWPPSLRNAYAGPYQAQAYLEKPPRGASLKRLDHTLFAALTKKYPSRLYHVGTGSRIYDWIAGWVPEWLITWLLQPRSAYIEADWEAI